MSKSQEFLASITEGHTDGQQITAMRGLARELGWSPAYELLNYPSPIGNTDHLIVEHGVQFATTFTFLRAEEDLSYLPQGFVDDLLGVSYNNLIDWHVFISPLTINIIHNRAERSRSTAFPTREIDNLGQPAFQEIVGPLNKTPKRYSSCDEAIIKMLSQWRRILHAELGSKADDRYLSPLINATFLFRALEDLSRIKAPYTPRARSLCEIAAQHSGEEVAPSKILRLAFERSFPDHLRSIELPNELELDSTTVVNFFTDFYRTTATPYSFDFYLLSKHALSKVYEGYVTLLESDPKSVSQASFFPAVSVERRPRKTGVAYTPQFIASFFSKYIRNNTTAQKFRQLRVLDPACGSGIFLRMILEASCNPYDTEVTPETITQSFSKCVGYDRNENAADAARLSLGLLHLVLTGKLPSKLSIHNVDFVRAINGKVSKRYDVVVANPPYIKLDDLPEADRESYKQALGPSFSGRPDAYLTIMNLGLACLKEGGFACFVLPQSFLDAQNAAAIRQTLAQEYVLHCIIDLSRVPIFQQQSIYNILIVAEKRRPDRNSLACWMARIDSHAGTALQAILDGRETRSSRYDVFRVSQSFFKEPQWYIAPKTTLLLKQRLAAFPSLGEQLSIQQGFISGADEIFLVDKKLFPANQQAVFVDFLPDTEIGFFQLPQEISTSFFFPFVSGVPIDERQLKREFPDVWKYLQRHRRALSRRKPVVDGSVPWWRPTRPRQPRNLLVPKIVCPHLMLTPRFAIDHSGRFAVSHAPYLAAPNWVPTAERKAYLRFFCGLLNSSIGQWLLANFTPNYGGGYNRLEVANIKRLPAPSLAEVNRNLVSRLIKLVIKLEREPYDEQSILELNQLSELVYGIADADLDPTTKV